jgi:hypothetical protein
LRTLAHLGALLSVRPDHAYKSPPPGVFVSILL